jgi:spermidine/putrescine transport system permease protein
MKTRSALLASFSGLVGLFIYAPIAIVVVYSFNSRRFGAGWGEFTARAYPALLREPAIASALKNSLLLAAVSTAIATLLGTSLALGLRHSGETARRWLDRFLYVPVFVPDIVMAVGLLTLFAVSRGLLGQPNLGLPAMILGHVAFQIPFVTLVVRARLAGFDESIEEAARDLGANPFQVAWRVTLPLLNPAILAGALLAFTLSLEDFVISFFTSGPGSTTLPIFIYSSVKRGITPEINALSTLIILASAALTVIATWAQRTRSE